MPGAPADLPPGTVLHHSRFYLDKTTGEYKPKFLVLLAPMRGGDWVVRVLTSQHVDVRPEQPPCHHGDPYPGFYLGVLDPSSGLGRKSWLDLRGLEDADASDMSRELSAKILTVTISLPADLLKSALACAAGADDTTRAQEQALRDQLAAL
jgi:hypothetical protein